MRHSLEEQQHIRSIRVQDIIMLKEELENRKNEIRLLENELDEWKGKYYEILEHLIELRSKLSGQ